MYVIYVEKKWLNAIGDMADLLLIEKEAGDYVSLLAGSVAVGFPFADADLVRKELTEKDELFVPTKIPAGLISAIFNLTSEQAKKLGFRPPEK